MERWCRATIARHQPAPIELIHKIVDSRKSKRQFANPTGIELMVSLIAANKLSSSMA
jgi:hypothetical protein